MFVLLMAVTFGFSQTTRFPVNSFVGVSKYLLVALIVYSDLKARYNGYDDVYTPGDLDLRVRNSVVCDSKTGDLILKVVSLVGKQNTVTVNLGPDFDVAQYSPKAQLTLLSCDDNPNSKRQWDTNETRTLDLGAPSFKLELPAYSVAVLRIAKK